MYNKGLHHVYTGIQQPQNVQGFKIVKKWQAGRQTDRHAEPAGQAEIM